MKMSIPSLLTIIVIVLGLIVLLDGCSRQPHDGPPQVRYGQDECATCGMILSDERHAAALRTVVDGETRDVLFDDIGDMLEYEQANPSLKAIRRYVHDFETRQWIDAAHSTFVRDEKVHTPMGSGILAYADEARARARQSGGQLLQWGTLRQTATAAGECCNDRPSSNAVARSLP